MSTPEEIEAHFRAARVSEDDPYLKHRAAHDWLSRYWVEDCRDRDIVTMVLVTPDGWTAQHVSMSLVQDGPAFRQVAVLMVRNAFRSLADQMGSGTPDWLARVVEGLKK